MWQTQKMCKQDQNSSSSIKYVNDTESCESVDDNKSENYEVINNIKLLDEREPIKITKNV